jgi:hypothetical protein
MNSYDFFLGDNAILTVEPQCRDGKVAVYLRVLRGIESVHIVRFIKPELALKISTAFYYSAQRAQSYKSLFEEDNKEEEEACDESGAGQGDMPKV